MSPGLRPSVEVLAVAMERAAHHGGRCVGSNLFGNFVPASSPGVRAFAAAVLTELDALEREAIPEVPAGDAPTEPSVPPVG